MKYRRYAIAFFAGLLLVLIGAWAKQALMPSEWQKQQARYNALRRGASLAPIALGIRAISLPGAKEERCPTCHLGAVMSPMDEPPLRAHGPTGCAFPIQAQGCTGCHRGEALRLTRAGAHGESADSRSALTDGHDPALRKARVEAGCAGCHLQRSAGVLRYDAEKVPHVAQGLRLFLSQGCASCHRIEGVASAGEHGPALTAIALRRSREALQQLLSDPRKDNATSPMPPLDAREPDREALITFLIAQAGPDREAGCSPACAMQARDARPSVVDHFDERIPERVNPATGALWARRIGCTGCHRAGAGDTGVPDLTRVGWYRTEVQLRNTLRDPRTFALSTWMPATSVPDTVLESLVAWLVMQKSPLPSTPNDVWNDVCRRCHGRDRDPKIGLLSKQPPVLQGRKSSIDKSVFVQKAGAGVEGTAMPPWGRMLSPSFLGAMHDALD